jgi:hypothetical protein
MAKSDLAAEILRIIQKRRRCAHLLIRLPPNERN